MSMKIAMRQMLFGRQTACMCVSEHSSHENCSYHIHKYLRKFNGIQRPFLFYMNLQVVFGGSTYIWENTVLNCFVCNVSVIRVNVHVNVLEEVCNNAY